MDISSLDQKMETLQIVLKKHSPLLVAFSGGVDSSFLLFTAKEVIGDKDQLVAVTAASPIHSKREIEFAKSFAKQIGIRHIVVNSDELSSSDFVENPGNRCYVCKKIIFSPVLEMAAQLGIKHVAHAVNLDDLGEYRPGLKAAEELGILAPLLEAGLSKSDIRLLSKEKGLSTWDKPSSGCLATRIPYGQNITKEKLKMVESAEDVLAEMGFSGCRVRYYDELAKIEVNADDLARLMDPALRSDIIRRFKDIGFLYISVDIEGYQSGRLNRSLISANKS